MATEVSEGPGSAGRAVDDPVHAENGATSLHDRVDALSSLVTQCMVSLEAHAGRTEDERRRLEQEISTLRESIRYEERKQRRKRQERIERRSLKKQRSIWQRIGLRRPSAAGIEEKAADPEIPRQGLRPGARPDEEPGEVDAGIAVSEARSVPRAESGPCSPWHRLLQHGAFYPRTGSAPPPAQGAFGTPGAAKIFLAGHEASRTGAPLVLLYLMKWIAVSGEYELFVFLERDGPLLEEFREIAHVVVNFGGVLYDPAEPSIPELLRATEEPQPHLAIFNSAEVWRFMEQMRDPGSVTRLALIDERLTHYPPDVHRIILDFADAIVFPSEAMRQVARKVNSRFEISRVIPHGLMKPEFGKIDRARARKMLRDELRVSPEAQIVIACGTVDQRKGADLFARLAALVIRKHFQDAHFVWLGGTQGGAAAYDQRKWIQHDIDLLKLRDRVHFINARDDPEPYYVGADVFLLPSRDDPFPCVIQEAMAAALPIVAFAEAGGTPEALVGGCGVVVPYLDLDAMAEAVSELLANPVLRREIGRRAEERVRTVYRSDDFAERIMVLAQETVGLSRAVITIPA